MTTDLHMPCAQSIRVPETRDIVTNMFMYYGSVCCSIAYTKCNGVNAGTSYNGQVLTTKLCSIMIPSKLLKYLFTMKIYDEKFRLDFMF